MELKGYKYKTCKTGVRNIYVKSKDQTPEACSRGGGGQLCPHIERMKNKHACTLKIRSHPPPPPKVKIYVQNLQELTGTK